MVGVLANALAPVRAAGRTATFFLKVLPMLPSRPVDWLTGKPVVETVRYPTRAGDAVGDLYRPPGRGPHPGLVVCLGVVPFGVDHPQVPILGAALARAGFAALLYWSPNMRDFRLDPEDIENIALAYLWLLDRPDVDDTRSGLLGTCVGGSFALMAAASPLIRDRVAFVIEWAAYSSMWTFARDIASSTRSNGAARHHWEVDQLTRRVYVRCLTAALEPAEAARLNEGLAGSNGPVEVSELSAEGRAVARLLSDVDVAEAEAVLAQLPEGLRARLDALSPLSYLNDIHAPLLVLAHDRDDGVIPVDESRRLWSVLGARKGAHYTEFGLFQHMDPTKKKVSPIVLVRELAKFWLFLYPIFRRTVAA